MPNEQKDKIKIQLYVLYINGEETIDSIKTSIYTDFLLDLRVYVTNLSEAMDS